MHPWQKAWPQGPQAGSLIGSRQTGHFVSESERGCGRPEAPAAASAAASAAAAASATRLRWAVIDAALAVARAAWAASTRCRACAAAVVGEGCPELRRREAAAGADAPPP